MWVNLEGWNLKIDYKIFNFTSGQKNMLQRTNKTEIQLQRSSLFGYMRGTRILPHGCQAQLSMCSISVIFNSIKVSSY